MTTLNGYARSQGRPGARNQVFILPSVVCSTRLTREIADEIGATTVSHQHGCGHIGGDITQTRDLFAGLATNPNVARSLIVSLGCETVQGKLIADELQRRGSDVDMISIQESGGYEGALRAGIERGRVLVDAVRDATRTPSSFAGLTLGITVSRADSRIAALISAAIAAGARVVLAADPSWASAVPGGAASIAVGQQPDAPVSTVAKAGAGAQLLAAVVACSAQVVVDFTALNQPPQGFPLAPVVSVAGSTGLHTLITDDFDLGADATTSAIVQHVVDVFSGAPTKTEERGSSTFAIPRLLRTM